jgi:hypothetical protein
VPGWLREVVNRCLAKDPADRYATAAELAGALRSGLRRGRRRAWAVGVAVVLALAVTAGIVGGALLRPDPGTGAVAVALTPFEDLPEVRQGLADLAQGQEVVLVENGERRAPFRWGWDDQTGLEVTPAGGPFSIHSRWTGPTPVEFLPSLPPGRFRIRARLRHDTAGEFGRVALYAGGQEWESGQGRHLSCVWVEFADQGSLATAPPPEGTTENSCAILREIWLTYLPRQGPLDPGEAMIEMEFAGQIRYASAWAQRRPSDYRTVELIVDNGAIQGQWGAEVVGAVAAAEMDQFVAKNRTRRRVEGTGKPGTRAGSGSVGLVVYNSKVSVQELRITPILK